MNTKILILLYQNVIDPQKPDALVCFYESLITELTAFGNDIKILNLKHCKSNFVDNELLGITQDERERIYHTIKTFKPDAILTFNNQITSEIIKNTNCPICLIEADDFYTCVNKDLITKFQERYFVFSFHDGWMNDVYKQNGISAESITYLHPATSVKSAKIEKTINISFIGSNFAGFEASLKQDFIKQPNFWRDFHNYIEEPYENNQFIINNFMKPFFYNFVDFRNDILASVSDLGLKLYGFGWDKLGVEFARLKTRFDKTPKYSLAHNQDIYNSSKVSLSISHPQCRGYAFPWRVYDILASNSILVTSYAKNLENLTAGFVKLPMYKSPYDARKLCQYAIDNPSYSDEIIAQSNEFIARFGSWKDNIKQIEEKIGVKLTKPKITSTNIHNISVTPKPVLAEIKRVDYSKMAFYSLVLALGENSLFKKLISSQSLQRYKDKLLKASQGNK